MKSGRSNKFNRALEHLKSTTIDEKLQMQLLSEIPTNNTTQIYNDLDGLVTVTLNPNLNELDLTQDDPAQLGADTSGLFMPDGTILTEEPPGDTSYLLGPMVAMYYTWSYPWTMIGYVRQSDRRMVNLGRIDGKLSDWNGTAGTAGAGTGTFNSYGQLTLEQALWFRDVQKQPGATNDPSTYNYYAFYPGPPSQTPDAYGRYPCVITGVSKNRTTSNRKPPEGFEKNPRPYEPLENQSVPHDIYGDLMLLGLSAAIAWALAKAIAAGSAAALSQANRIAQSIKNRILRGALNPFGQRAVRSGAAGRTRVDVYSGRPYRGTRGYGKTTYGTTDKATGNTYTNPGPFKGTPGTGGSTNPKGTLDRGTLPQRYIDKYGSRSVLGQKQIKMGKKAAKRTFGEEFFTEEAGGDIISALEDALKETQTIEQYMTVLDGIIAKIEQRESELKKQTSEEISPRKKLIQEIKKPYIVKEVKQEKLKGYRPKVYGALHAQYDKLMQKAENPAAFKKMDETVWTKQDKHFNTRLSQERKNEVLDHLGTGDHFWDILTETGRSRSEKGLKEKYGDFTLVRKEQLVGDTLLFLVDENGKKETILQSEYSDRIARQIEEPLWEQETLDAPNDPLIRRVRNKLATQIDYSDKPSKMGYPDGPTPQQVAGYHPEYGKRSAYYNALDPQSADAMPPTGDPETDAKVNAQKTPLKQVKQVYRKKGKPNS